MWNPIAACTSEQREQLHAYADQLTHFNRRINLISRDDVTHVLDRHIMHALVLTRRRFVAHSRVVDWGTGGGLPAIPLAICFPDVTFYAVDAVGKKVQAVQTMARRLGLANLEAWHGRAEQFPHAIDYSVSRATAPLRTLWGWHEAVATHATQPSDPETWPQGLICLKGGDLSSEISDLKELASSVSVNKEPLRLLLADAYFATKQIVTVST